MKKTIGWILLIVGILAFIGGMTSTVEQDPIVSVGVFIIKVAMVIGGGSMAFSTKKVKKKDYEIRKVNNTNFTSIKPKTIKDLLPQFASLFFKDDENKNDITELIFTQKGTLNSQGIENSYKFILSRESLLIKLTCVFNDNETIPVSESLVVASLEESQKFNALQWREIIESLKSKVDHSYIEMRANNLARHVYDNNLLVKIKNVKKEIEKKAKEYDIIVNESDEVIKNRTQFLQQLIEKIENGDSSSDLEMLKEEDEQIAIRLDKIEKRKKQLENEIYSLNDFIESEEVKEFISKKGELGKFSNEPITSNKYISKFVETTEKDLITGTDIFSCLEIHGLDKTFDALQALNSETKKMFDVKGQLTSHPERFEFDLFAFAYYLLYVKQIDMGKHAELYDKVVHFYSHLAYDMVRHNPDEIYLKIILTKDRYSFVIEKIQAYQFEIRDIKTNIHHFAKYLFASFYMYQMMEAKEIREQSKNIIGNNIVDFHKEVFAVMNMLESISKNIIKYVHL